MDHPALQDPFKFYAEFTSANKPVIIKHLADVMLPGAGNGYRKFKQVGPDSFFRNAFMDGGDSEIQAEVDKLEDREGPNVGMTFDTFLKEIDDDKRKDELYALVDLHEEEKLLELIHFPQFASCKEHLHQEPVLWYSSGGTSSVLHHDDADNILVVLAGSKRVILAHQEEWKNLYAKHGKPLGTSPVRQEAANLKKFPKFKNVKFIKGTLEEGDGLFIPHSYWHQVVSNVGISGATARRNVAINFWWNHKDDWTWWDPLEQDEFSEAANLKDYDQMRRGKEFKCTPRAGDTFDQIRLVNHERFKELLFVKRHPNLSQPYFRSELE